MSSPWWNQKHEEPRIPAPKIRALPQPITGHCGVCGVYATHQHVHDDLSDDGRDCARMVATGALLCTGCWDFARSVERTVAVTHLFSEADLALRCASFGEIRGARRGGSH